MLQAMWDLSPPTRDRTHVPTAVEAQSLNHWSFREVPISYPLFQPAALLPKNSLMGAESEYVPKLTYGGA